MSATYSGTNNFIASQNMFLVEDAYARIGILSDLLTPYQLQSANRSANFVLTEFINKGLNLFTVRQGVLGLTANQSTYQLPQYLNTVLEAALRTTNRPLGGTAFSSAGGTAQNAFNGVGGLACTQTAPNGYISYNYGANNVIQVQMVGIQSNVTTTYSLVAEYSFDNISWVNSITFPVQSYPYGQIVWAVPQVPINAQYFRIREIGGATLNVQQLYFNRLIYDTAMTPISRSEWVWYPQKNETGRPIQYYFDRQIAPTITLWPVPTGPYNAMYYTYTQLIQDFGTLLQSPQISQQFYNAFVDGLAVQLARKFNTEALESCMQQYQISFDLAARENFERVPLRIYGDYSSGWTQP